MLWLNKGMEITNATKKVKRLFLKVVYTEITTKKGRSQKPRKRTEFQIKPQFINHSDSSDLTAKTAISS